MELLIAYLNDGHSITDLLYSILVIAAIIVCVEKFIKWIYDLFIKMYKRKRGQEDENTTIVKNTEQIKNLATARFFCTLHSILLVYDLLYLAISTSFP